MIAYSLFNRLNFFDVYDNLQIKKILIEIYNAQRLNGRKKKTNDNFA